MRTTHYRTLGGYGNSLHAALSPEQLRAFAPSVFADAAHTRTSSRYSFLPTSSILDGMAGEGWVPVAAQEQTVRDQSRHGFQKHMLRFAHRDDLSRTGGERAEIVLLNSHDRSSAYQLHAGIFRFVCMNGLVLCDETFSRTSIKHQGFKPSMVIEATMEIVDQIPEIMDGIQSMKGHTLTEGERGAFAEAAAIVRFGDLEKAPVRPAMLLSPHRTEDAGNDAWRTLNVVQENCVRGGQRDRFKQSATGRRMPKSRAVTGIEGNVSLNKALHHLAKQLLAMRN